MHVFLLPVPMLRAAGDGCSFSVGLSCTAALRFSLYLSQAINLCGFLCICKTLAFATPLIRPESRSALISPVLLNILFSDIASQIAVR